MTCQGTLFALIAYLIGGIPIGYLVARAKGLDIRKVGSGNIGASNVLRTLGTKAGLSVWLLDVFKGFIPTYGAAALQPSFEGRAWLGAIGLAAVVGHCFSPYLRLQGGRGVSTILGICLALNAPAAFIGFLVWIVVVYLTRYISLASIIASLGAAPLLALFGSPPAYWGYATAAGLLVTWRHWPNIQRLLAGTESKIGERAKVTALDE